MATISQRTFAGGEISPSLYARVDIAKYQTALRTCRNFYVMRHGGVANRSGSQFICEVSDSTKQVRLIPFVFNNDQTYVLEFGDQYMRVIKNGVQLTNASQVITSISNTNPAVLTYVGSDTFANGDEVYVSGVAGMTEVNGRNFKVANVDTGANTFELQYMDGTAVDASGWSAGTGGTVEEVYEIATPYLEAELPDLYYVQSADVVTLVHPNHEPRNLSRAGDTSWSLAVISGEPSIAQGTGVTVTNGAAGANTYRYKMTAIKRETFEESLPCYGAAKTVSGATVITNANPPVVTTNVHNYESGDEVIITGISGMTEVNDRPFLITVLSTTTFSLQDLEGNDIDATGWGTATSGGTVQNTTIRALSAAAPTTGAPHVIAMSTPPSDAVEYNIYRADSNGVFGWIGVSPSPSFNDTGAVTPDVSDTPPRRNDLFVVPSRYPAVVGYYQQRRMFANTNDDPETIWGSQTGSFNNFTFSRPINDSDALSFTMASNQVNSVRHIIDLGKLVVLTQGGEWAVQGDAAGTLTPSDINARQYTYNGASKLRPIIIGNTALYVQARGNILRDLGFDIASDGYRGVDLTVYSNHLVDGYQINDWAYAQVPESIVWAIRNDGTLLGLTYVREQQLLAWHRHDTEGGVIENVCVVPEGNEDVLYWVVQRTINGGSVRYIERVGSRFILPEDIAEATHLDSYLTYDGRNTSATTMTLTSGGGWTYEDTLTLTASAGYFTSGDVGKEIHLTGASGDIIRCAITAYSSGTVVSVTPNRTVPVNMRSTAISIWSYATNVVSGLWHLEGKSVSVFADGYVVANPNNDAYVTLTVADGEITLDDFYGLIHVGLPITSDVETLDIDTASGETLADKKQIVTGVTLFTEKTRGLWVGGREPSSGVLDGMTELKIRESEGYDEPVDLLTGKISVNIESTWNSNGRVFIRQTDPVPASILAIAPAGLFPVRG